MADDLKNESAAAACWQNLELGRPAALLARAAETIAPIRGPAYVVSTACTAGAKALAEGARLLLSGAASSVIAGGADILNPFTDAGFRALGAVSGTTARPFAADRDGLHLGEGGALFLLSLSPQMDGRPALAKLSGWGETGDAHHISAPEPEGRGAEAAMRRALEKAACLPDALSFVFLHGTATEQNDRAESAGGRRRIRRGTRARDDRAWPRSRTAQLRDARSRSRTRRIALRRRAYRSRFTRRRPGTLPCECIRIRREQYFTRY